MSFVIHSGNATRISKSKLIWARHFLRWRYVYLLVVPMFFLTWLYFIQHYQIGINVVTASLPYKVVLIAKNASVRRGDLFVFKWHGGDPWPNGASFFKVVKGLPGDLVEVKGREVFINGTSVGVAKERSSSGVPVAVIAPGVIPPGRIYAYAPHRDSLDSRYQTTGLISERDVIGVAHVLF